MKFIVNNVVWRILPVPPYHDKLKRTDGLYTKGEIHKVVGISPDDRRAVIQIGDEVCVLLDEEYDIIEIN